MILASGSAMRAQLLQNAGVNFEIHYPHVDEQNLKAALAQEGATAKETALVLAEAKARQISQKFPDQLVLGCDQMLECNNHWFDKPTDMMAARAQLMTLRGKTHSLYSAAAFYRQGQRVWAFTEQADLEMRAFSDDFLNEYLNAVDDDILSSVGAYQLEGLGAQLFAKISGSYFAILGLPLLAVLDYLRENGELMK